MRFSTRSMDDRLSLATRKSSTISIQFHNRNSRNNEIELIFVSLSILFNKIRETEKNVIHFLGLNKLKN